MNPYEKCLWSQIFQKSSRMRLTKFDLIFNVIYHLKKGLTLWLKNINGGILTWSFHWNCQKSTNFKNKKVKKYHISLYENSLWSLQNLIYFFFRYKKGLTLKTNDGYICILGCSFHCNHQIWDVMNGFWINQKKPVSRLFEEIEGWK